MNVTLIEESRIQQLESKLQQIVNLLSEKTEEQKNSEWIEGKKVPKILGVSPKTWQNYRDKKIIPYSQIGRKIYVKRKDIDDFLSRNRFSANN